MDRYVWLLKSQNFVGCNIFVISVNFLDFCTSRSGLSKDDENNSDDILAKSGADDSWNFLKK